MVWTFGTFRLDPVRFELTAGGEPVEIEPQVLSLLIHLVSNRDRLVSKDDLVAAVWKGGTVSDASIASRIRSARQAIGDDGERQAMIRTVHGRGYRFVAEVRGEPATLVAEGAGETPPVSHECDRPSIAVLPFRALASPTGLDVLSDALPHEIIQALSRLRWLAVIARGSSFRFREQSAELAATALSARYILSGVIETHGVKVSVTVELADTRRSQVIWGDRLSSSLDGIEDLRQRIVDSVIAALEIQIPENEARRAALIGTERLDAWANFHMGLHHLYRFTPDAIARARHHFDRAVVLDPGLARAHAGLSFTSFLEAFLQFGPQARGAAEAARRHAERGIELDPLDPFTHFNMGRSFWLTGEPEVAQGWLQRAVDLNPNYAQGFYASSFTAMLMGNASETIAKVDTAQRLSPLDPLLYGMFGVRALMAIQTGEIAQAAYWADRAAATPGAHHLISLIAAVANGLGGREPQALRWSDEARRRVPAVTVAQFLAAFPIRDDVARARIASELERLGFRN